MAANDRYRALLHKPTKSDLWMMAAILLWGVACFAFFEGCYRYHFFYQEQNQLFLLSADYLRSYFARPAWLACMAGDFLTQFYYYLYAGPALLTLVLLTVGDLARRALQQAGLTKGWAFAIAVALMTLETFCCLRYSHRLASVIALGGGAATFLMATLLFRYGRWAIAITMLTASILTYWLFGYGLWVLQILAFIYAIHHFRGKTYNWSIIFFNTPILLAPFIIAFSPQLYSINADTALTYPDIGKPRWPEWSLENTLAVDNEYHFGNWEKVERLVESHSHPNDVQLFFYNLVQAQKGTLPDKLLKYVPNQLGTFYAIGPETPLITIINMNELYWALGDMTLTERAAMMTNVFAPQNRNVRMIKRLAECNLVSGDTLAANKFLRLLKKTWVYASWARRIAARDPKACQYLVEKRKYGNQADDIRLTDNLHLVMMQLLDSNPQNIVALDYILCSDLLLKDIANFKRDYDRYCYNQGRERVKPLYQQALMIYLAGTNAPEEQWRQYIHDEEQMQRFQAYNSQRGHPSFSDTYWYYFDTAKTPEI